jgi:group I intron endonuclease
MIWHIYKFENKLNGRCYIGLTKQNIKNRLKLHYHDVRSGRGQLVHRAFAKYGTENFWFHLLGTANSLEEANQKEILAIKIFNSKSPYGYNLTIGGDGTQNPSDKTREKMRQSQLGKKQSDETIEKRRLARLGVKRAPEVVKKSADARRGAKRSEEFRQQCRERAARQFSDLSARAKVSQTMKAKWADPQYRTMILEAQANAVKGA